MFYSDFKASSDSGIVRDKVTLSNHHFGSLWFGHMACMGLWSF
ncbi:hypothetical protein F383_00723 [Gossypium arboreum]|uniref:Uncharacterized protein n=1 Tax=Gossypium arboreum TaxID=29729 RepID=A0A0B0PMC8_GOSAR|nr:hypothetical protein F383_00723 [Gossypium arboreum]